MSFLRAIRCYHKSPDSVTFSINIGVMSVRKYISSMRKQWNSTAIKHMHEQLKSGRFLLLFGPGNEANADQSLVITVSYYKLLSNMIRIHKPNYITITKASFKELDQTLVCTGVWLMLLWCMLRQTLVCTAVWLMYTTDVLVYLL